MPIGSTDFKPGRYVQVSAKPKVNTLQNLSLDNRQSVRFLGNSVPGAKKESIWKRIWRAITFPFRWFASLFKSKKATDNQPKPAQSQSDNKTSTSKSDELMESQDLNPESSNPQNLQEPENAGNSESSSSNPDKQPDDEPVKPAGHEAARPNILDTVPELKRMAEMNEKLRQLERPRQSCEPKPKKFTVGETLFLEERAMGLELNRLIMQKKPDEIRALIAQGVDVNAKGHGMWGTPLFHAVFQDDIEVIKALLTAKNLDIDAKNPDGSTALQTAVIDHKNPEIIKLLLNNGADINACDEKGNSALHRAVNRKKPNLFSQRSQAEQAIQALLKIPGIDVNLQNKDGDTPIHIAAQYAYPCNNFALVDLLKSVDGIDLDVKNKWGAKPFDYHRFNMITLR